MKLKKIRIFWTAWRRILHSYRQRLLNMNRSHRFCFPPFFFVSFISRTFLVHNWFVFAMCLVGNWIKVCFEFHCSARFPSLRETPVHYSFITKQNKTTKTLTHFIHTCQLSRIIREYPGYDNNLPVSRTGHQISRIKSSYELFCALIWNLSHFLPKFEFSMIQSSVSGVFSHVFHHWQNHES